MRDDCAWLKTGVCLNQKCEGCKAYLASGSMRGKKLYERHKKEVVDVITPIQRRYRGWLARYKKEGYKGK